MALVEENHEGAELVPRPVGERPVRPGRAEQSPQRETPRAPAQPEDRPALRAGLGAIRRHPYRSALAVIAIVAAIAAGVIWWLNARQYESTDDAYIDARTVPISAQITGDIVDVPVDDNQPVVVGAPLLRIDPRDYRVAVEQAQAQLEQAQASVANVDAQIGAQQANIEQAEKQAAQAKAALDYAQQQNARDQALLKTGAGTVQQAQQSASTLTQEQAAYAAAQASTIAVQKRLAVLQAQRKSALAQVASARAALDKAKIDLARTTIHAPVDGHIANLTGAKGAYAQIGQALMSLVPRQVWVTANFKETALDQMRVGQPVDIRVDAYPGRVFHGHVDSIQAGSGAAFSLLPPENATGNFVKVVQRVPVKIVFDRPPGVYLGPGMSVVPSVKVR